MELEANETITFTENNVVWYKSKYQAFPGKLILTNKKLIYLQNKIKSGGGLLGSILASSSKKTKGGVLFSSTLNTMSVSKGKGVRRRSFMLKISSKGNQQCIEILGDDKLFSKIQSAIDSAADE